MRTQTYVRRTRIEAPAEVVFRWHARPGAFERLTPPWENVEILERSGGIEDGGRITLTTRLGPLRMRWVAEHRDYIEGRQFRDIQLVGPFAQWDHTHSIEPDGPTACYLEDRIVYAPPMGAAGQLFGGFVRRKLQRLFDYRHHITKQDIASHTARKEEEPMKILVTGSTGLVGSTLIPFLTTGGHEVVRLVRSKSASNTNAIYWNPTAGEVNSSNLEGLDAVVHLAGENIADGRWTAEKKARIRDSRIRGTQLLCETLAELNQPPKVLVAASAIGYYGDRGDDVLNEDSESGSGFLAGVCREWEAATKPASEAGIRVVNLRIGIELAPKGGALAKMLPPFRMGAGGVIGNRRQYMSWISLDDLVGAIHHAIITEDLHGPVNATAAKPITNHQFTKTLGRVLGRPTLFPLPAFAARLALGEMADALLMASTAVKPMRLAKSGYAFRQPTLDGALRHLLGK